MLGSSKREREATKRKGSNKEKGKVRAPYGILRKANVDIKSKGNLYFALTGNSNLHSRQCKYKLIRLLDHPHALLAQ